MKEKAMGLECSHCERDLRAGHADNCDRPNVVVRREHPKAFAHKWADKWVIYEPTWKGNETIGEGKTQREAWEAALRSNVELTGAEGVRVEGTVMQED